MEEKKKRYDTHKKKIKLGADIQAMSCDCKKNKHKPAHTAPEPHTREMKSNLIAAQLNQMSVSDGTTVQRLTHQVILPALGGVFRVPLFLGRAHYWVHIGRVSITVVSWIISSVPASPSHSGELTLKQADVTEAKREQGGIRERKDDLRESGSPFNHEVVLLRHQNK